MKKLLCLALLLGSVVVGAMSQENRPWFDTKLSMQERTEALIDAMTFEEKVMQLMNEAPGIPRLGILPYNWWNESLHGIGRTGRATVFPQAIGMGATFNPELIYRVTTAISDEARAKFNIAQANGNYSQYSGLTFWSPNVNIFRDPRWGRGQETYGEDPFLTSIMGVAYVKGLQGDDSKYLKAAACAKHYAVHSGPEAVRHQFDVSPSLKDLHETYLPAFEALVKEAKVEAVMGAYNRVYGESASASQLLLVDILRKEWGFDGHIVSDCGAVYDIYVFHKIVDTPEEAAALSAKAGLNLNCGGTYRALVKAKDKGLVTEDDIDYLLRPLIKCKIKLGLFDPKEANLYNAVAPAVVESDEHRALSREVATQSIVMLQNRNNALPLDKNIKTLYVTGPMAANTDFLLGNYYGLSSNLVTILEGITSKVSIGSSVNYSPGILFNTPTLNPIDWTTGAAKGADAIIVALGISGLIEGEEGESIASEHRGDRMDITLPQNQINFLKELRKDNTKPIIAVITGGSPIAMPEVEELADAILFVWYPGQEGGGAVGDIIFGDAVPSGRLPITFPKSVDQLPPYEDYSMKGRTYRYMTEKPQFPFGFGLSYTKFDYSAPVLNATKNDYTIKATISNVGDYDASEVVQLYVVRPGAGVDNPLSSLIGVKRVELPKGQGIEVEFTVTREQLKSITEKGESKLLKGNYKFIVSGAAPVERSTELGTVTPLVLDFKIK